MGKGQRAVQGGNCQLGAGWGRLGWATGLREKPKPVPTPPRIRWACQGLIDPPWPWEGCLDSAKGTLLS